MNKQQLAVFNLLKTRFEGCEEKTLEKIATKKGANITDEDVQSVAEGISFQSIIDFARTEASASAEKRVRDEIEKGKKDDKGKKEEDKTPKKDDDVPEWAKPIIDQNKTLLEKLAALDAEKAAGARKSQLIEAIGGASESFKTRYQKDFDRMSFKDDAEFAEWLNEVKTDAVNFKQEEINRQVAGGSYKEKTEEEYTKMFKGEDTQEQGIPGAVKLDY